MMIIKNIADTKKYLKYNDDDGRLTKLSVASNNKSTLVTMVTRSHHPSSVKSMSFITQ